MKAKRRLVSFVTVCFFVTASIEAAPVDGSQVSNAVLRAMTVHSRAGVTARQKPQKRLFLPPTGVKQVRDFVSHSKTVGHIADLEPAGFYLMRTDDELPPWKIRSDACEFDKLPPGFLAVIRAELAQEQEALSTLRRQGKPMDPKHKRDWQSLLGSDSDGPEGDPPQPAPGVWILTTEWAQ